MSNKEKKETSATTVADVSFFSDAHQAKSPMKVTDLILSR